jgi:hypothetical protein
MLHILGMHELLSTVVVRANGHNRRDGIPIAESFDASRVPMDLHFHRADIILKLVGCFLEHLNWIIVVGLLCCCLLNINRTVIMLYGCSIAVVLNKLLLPSGGATRDIWLESPHTSKYVNVRVANIA